MKSRKQTLRKEPFFTRHRYAVFFFVFVVLYNFLIIKKGHIPGMDEALYSWHLVDFSVGFCTKLLPGAIFYGIFGEHATKTIALVYEIVLLLAFFAGLAFLLEKFLQRAEAESRGAAFFLVILYLTGPCTFQFFADTIGSLDVYWVFISLLFFLCLESKWARWLIPVLCFLMIMIHYSTMVSYLLMFLIILLFKVSEGKSSKVWAVIFLLAFVVSVGMFVYFLMNESSNLTMTREEFDQFLTDRGSKDTNYFNYSLYEYAGEGFVDYRMDTDAGFAVGLFNSFLSRIQLNAQYVSLILAGIELSFFVTLIYGLLLLSPILFCAYQVLGKHIGALKGNPLKRAVYVMLMIQFWVTLIIPILVSIDSGRWLIHSFLIFFTTLLYLMYSDRELRVAVFEKIRSFAKQPFLYFWVYAYQFAMLVSTGIR